MSALSGDLDLNLGKKSLDLESVRAQIKSHLVSESSIGDPEGPDCSLNDGHQESPGKTFSSFSNACLD